MKPQRPIVPTWVAISAALYLLSVGLGLQTSCKTSSIPPVVTNGVASVVDCTKDSIAAIATENISSVELSLVQDNWKELLIKDATRLGQDALACIIQYIVTEARRDAVTAKSDINSHNKSERGQAWIAEHQVTFKE